MNALWLCLHLPRLPLDALGPWPEPLAACPALVWAADARGARQVCCVNAAARSLDLQPGQRLNTAEALAPQALRLARNPAREAAALERLALALGCLTPHICPAPPDQLLLEVRASLRLFGGIRRLRTRALAITRSSGLQVRSSLATTPLAAQWLAAAGQRHRHALRLESTRQRLQPLALARLAGRLAPDEVATADSLEMLQALGARTLADLHRLPRSGLNRRGAAAWVDALDRAEGRRPDPRRWHEPPEACRLDLELPHRAEAVADLEGALTPLVHSLCGWLARRWQAATALRLNLRHEQGARRHLPDQLIELQLTTPSRDAAHLITLLRERLQQVVLSAAVDSLRLELTGQQAEAGRPLALLPDQPDERGHQDALAGLIDRLRARLGDERLLRLQLQPDARPEKAQQRAAPQPGGREGAERRLPSSAAAAAAAPPRPAWLLEAPRPLTPPGPPGPPGAAGASDNTPALDGRPLRLLTRPERIETGWHDGALLRRDYHVALGEDGRLWWIFRERQGSLEQADGAAPRWFLHGLFG